MAQNNKSTIKKVGIYIKMDVCASVLAKLWDVWGNYNKT